MARHSPDALLGRIRFHASPAGWPLWLLTYHPASFAGLQVLLTVLAPGAELVAVERANVPELARAAREHHPTHIHASTEGGALFAVRDGQAGFPARWLAEGVDGVRLRILDGELQVLSPRAMLGYTSGATPPLDDGWLATGDLVARRGDRVCFLGCADSVISVGAAKLTPEEVEASADLDRLREALLAAARAQPEPYKVPRVLRFVESIRVSEAGKKDRSA